MWSRKFEKCKKCGTNETNHKAQGLCMTCYHQEIEKRHKSHARGLGIAAKKLTRQYLLVEYFDNKKSPSDIAKECGCTRQYVYKKMVEYNIPFRNKSSARKIALERQKIVVERIDDEGLRHRVVHQKLVLNENFFSSWTLEMAYVLGVVFTDGCLHLGKSIHSKTVNKRLSISQKEPKFLRKILVLMKCNAVVHFKKRRIYGNVVAGSLYWFDISNEKIYDDLINLGLHPRKSLNVEFPRVPQKYVRHFIRGCWDGDGSVYYEKARTNITANFYSGSLKFIEGLLAQLGKIGLPKRTIHKTKAMRPSYYFKYYGAQCSKLYHYLYDSVPSSQYLERKYRLFNKFCDRQQNSLF